VILMMTRIDAFFWNVLRREGLSGERSGSVL